MGVNVEVESPSSSAKAAAVGSASNLSKLFTEPMPEATAIASGTPFTAIRI